MSSQVRFYADKEDLIESLKHVEDVISIKYADAWIHYSKESIPIFDTLSCWSELGINRTGRLTGAGFFLIVPRSAELTLKVIKMDNGACRYKYEPILNPVSIVFQPSGVFDEEGGCRRRLVGGMFGTASREPDALKLYKKFRKLFLSGYMRREDGSYLAPHVNLDELTLF